jgi:hypothetical protein
MSKLLLNTDRTFHQTYSQFDNFQESINTGMIKPFVMNKKSTMNQFRVKSYTQNGFKPKNEANNFT